MININAASLDPHAYELRRVDVELGVFEGPPKSLVEEDVYTVEDTPHIHNADVTITHPSDGTVKNIGDTRVMVAHGYKMTRDGEDLWVLANKKSVVGIAEWYNEKHPDKPIELLAVCDPTKGVHRAHSSMQHAAGSDVQVSGQMLPSGRIGLHLNLADAESGASFLKNDEGGLQLSM
jgi:hypothetical protein